MTLIEPSIAEHFLFPSTLFYERAPHRVLTILGSCVSVCLFDPELGIGGINHYMLPWWNGNETPSTKYGDVAIERLIEKMILNGSRKENLVAKVFGGASQHAFHQKLLDIGARNISTAEKLLATHKIKIIAQNTGGTKGRRIVFHSQTNQVLMKYLEPTELKQAV